jgi:hypothetical protein
VKILMAACLALFVANAAYAQTSIAKDSNAESKARASVTTPSLNAPQTGGAKQQEEIPAKR